MATKPLSVAIVGAGIGGLTLAAALHDRGLRPVVYEQAGELREVGAAVALSANGTRVLHELGLRDQLAACGAVPTELIYRHRHTGERVFAHPVGEDYQERFGAPLYGLHRAELQKALAAACGPDALRLDHQLTGISPHTNGYQLEFANGHTAHADLVVGADGVRSTVRRWVTAHDPAIYSGTSGFRGLVPVEVMPSLPDPGAIQFWMGPGAHVLHYPIGDGSMVNFLAVVDEPSHWTKSSWVEPISLDTLCEYFSDWHPGVREMLAATTLHQRWALFAHTPMNHWYRERIVLLGDAAHAMLPHHGQGANQTIEDAVTLATLLHRHTPEQALDRYQRLRRARTRAIQRSSWVASDILHLPDGPAAERDRHLATITDTLQWIHEHDAAATAA